MTRRTTISHAVAPLAASLAIAVPADSGVHASKATRRTAADPGGDLAFTKKRLSAPPGRIKLVMRNPEGSGLDHGIGIRGKDGPSVAPGERSRTTIRITEPGRYTFYCTFPGHRAAGMKGRLSVE
jgi:uncharacterized cupredoxin-like copper-binding protein